VSAWLVIAAAALAGLSGVPGLLRPRAGHVGERLFTWLMTGAAAMACLGAAGALALGWSGDVAATWSVPGGRFAVRVDAIAAIFVIPIALLAALAAWYGLEYWAERDHPHDGRKLRAFHGAVTAGMLTLVIARNAVLFLVGWEVMALAAFLLVSTEDEKPIVREVGYVYLLTTRLGTLCLFAMFALLGAAAGTLDMAGWPAALESPLRDAIFVLAVVGFGLKAGIMPFHIWLPGAHASAPSQISALMSGVLIKTGIYGLVRLTSLCAAPPLWWGSSLIALGVVSGVLGVAFAIAQHDLKRLLAYHSVENIGIICIGLGVALVGRTTGRPELVVLGLSGALLHVWNHGLFKALLFLAAGSVVHATGTRQIDQLGGLWRRMPRTGLAFLVGAVAICGLPPLNGLVSELLIYLGLFRLAVAGHGAWLVGALAAPALALVGALAVACFVKVFGAVFLGQPRSPAPLRAHEAGRAMLAPMAVLAAGCAFIGLGAPLLSGALDAAVATWSSATPLPALGRIAPLVWVSATSAGLLIVLVAAGAWIARRARAGAAPGEVGTWDCGYAAPAASMQYTSSSFAGTLVGLLAIVLRPDSHPPRLQEAPFPRAAAFHSHVPDAVLDRAVVPIFALAGRLFARLRPIQHGSVHLYLLYILGAVVVLLLWS
jgi:hydrogenase-4 component B